MNTSIVSMIKNKPVETLTTEDFFSKLKNKCPEYTGIERTRRIFKLFDVRNGEKFTKLYCKSDIILLFYFIEKFLKYLLKNMVLILYFVSVYLIILTIVL